MSLPDYNFLPAPLWLLAGLQIFTLTLHLIAMNFLVGGLIVVLHGKFAERWQNPTARLFVRLFPIALAATITLGIAPLLFLQVVFPRQIYSAAIVSGWFWLAIVPAAIAGYYLIYSASFSRTGGTRSPRAFLITALLAFIFISLVYSSVFSMAERPELIKQLYQRAQGGLTWNPHVGDYLFRWLHMIFGAVTVGGFFVGLLGRNDVEGFETGKRFFLWGMITASLVGMAYLLSLGPYLPKFMETPGIWALTIGILLSLGSLHFFFKRRFLPASLMVFVSILSMVATRHYVRLVKLEGLFDPSSMRVVLQWSPLLLFLVCFVIAAALVWYMLRLFFAEAR
jgi:hypothetical protein